MDFHFFGHGKSWKINVEKERAPCDTVWCRCAKFDMVGEWKLSGSDGVGLGVVLNHHAEGEQKEWCIVSVVRMRNDVWGKCGRIEQCWLEAIEIGTQQNAEQGGFAWQIAIGQFYSHNNTNNNNKHFKCPLTNVTKAHAATRIPWPIHICQSEQKRFQHLLKGSQCDCRITKRSW